MWLDIYTQLNPAIKLQKANIEGTVAYIFLIISMEDEEDSAQPKRSELGTSCFNYIMHIVFAFAC